MRITFDAITNPPNVVLFETPYTISVNKVNRRSLMLAVSTMMRRKSKQGFPARPLLPLLLTPSPKNLPLLPRLPLLSSRSMSSTPP
jgi:hypothetical protein